MVVTDFSTRTKFSHTGGISLRRDVIKKIHFSIGSWTNNHVRNVINFTNERWNEITRSKSLLKFINKRLPYKILPHLCISVAMYMSRSPHTILCIVLKLDKISQSNIVLQSKRKTERQISLVKSRH